MATATNNDIAKAIYLASKENEGDIVAHTMRFLVRKRLLSRAPDILSKLENLINKAENKIVVKVVTAEKLETKERTELEHFLKKRYGALHVLFNEVIDKNVIGGIKVEVGDEILDLTVKHRINKLQAYLTS